MAQTQQWHLAPAVAQNKVSNPPPSTEESNNDIRMIEETLSHSSNRELSVVDLDDSDDDNDDKSDDNDRCASVEIEDIALQEETDEQELGKLLEAHVPWEILCT